MQIISLVVKYSRFIQWIYGYDHGLWQDQASKDRALQALSSMSSAQIVSATALHPATGSGSGTVTGRSVLPSVLCPHMSSFGMHYPAYSSSGVGHSLQVMSSVQCTGLCFGCLEFFTPVWSLLCLTRLGYELETTN